MESEDVLQHPLPNRVVRDTQQIFTQEEELEPSGSNVAVRRNFQEPGQQEEEHEEEDVAICDDGRDSFFANLGDARTVVRPNGMRMNRLPLSSGTGDVRRRTNSEAHFPVEVGTEMRMGLEGRKGNGGSTVRECLKRKKDFPVRSRKEGDVQRFCTEGDVVRSGKKDIVWKEERRREIRRCMYVETAELD